jgi:hypothetical protein
MVPAMRPGRLLPFVFAGLLPLAAAALEKSDGGRTVKDTAHKLVWQRDVLDEYRTWADARKFCADGAGGLPGSGWRLPTRNELLTIVATSRGIVGTALDDRFFPPEHTSDWFWTVTPYDMNPQLAWDVYFDEGGKFSQHHIKNRNRVRCVRTLEAPPPKRTPAPDAGTAP